MYWHDMTGWGWAMMISVWLLVAVLIAVTLRLAVAPRERTALDILEEGLARGDITPDEYRERRGLLDHRPA